MAFQISSDRYVFHIVINKMNILATQIAHTFFNNFQVVYSVYAAVGNVLQFHAFISTYNKHLHIYTHRYTRCDIFDKAVHSIHLMYAIYVREYKFAFTSVHVNISLVFFFALCFFEIYRIDIFWCMRCAQTYFKKRGKRR